MTFSLIARDASSGTLGMVISSSSPAVAARCAYARANVGVVSTQNITNPLLGPLTLEELAQGHTATEALAKSLLQEKFPAYRQVLVLDSQGNSVIHTGDHVLGIHHNLNGKDYAAAGNLLAHPGVIDNLVSGYLSSSEKNFEARLLAGLQAAVLAGGEAGPVHSAGLIVVEDHAWPVTDLRIDWSEDPLHELEQLWKIWEPQKYDYALRAIHPLSAPSYGVPGDE